MEINDELIKPSLPIQVERSASTIEWSTDNNVAILTKFNTCHSCSMLVKGDKTKSWNCIPYFNLQQKRNDWVNLHIQLWTH